MIALALAGDPPLIIADEPTTALDSTVQFEIIALLGELRRERQLGLLLVSHDLGLIESATDTVVVMYGGMTVESGSTSDVLRAHTHPYTRALLYARPERAQPGRLLRAIPGQPPAPGEVGAGCPFAPRCPEALPDCTTESPPVVEVAPGHQVRCVLPQAVGRS
jgi:oligopeptide/dipeptide ABC transporter ATP-binding protein